MARLPAAPAPQLHSSRIAEWSCMLYSSRCATRPAVGGSAAGVARKEVRCCLILLLSFVAELLRLLSHSDSHQAAAQLLLSETAELLPPRLRACASCQCRLPSKAAVALHCTTPDCTKLLHHSSSTAASLHGSIASLAPGHASNHPQLRSHRSSKQMHCLFTCML